MPAGPSFSAQFNLTGSAGLTAAVLGSQQIGKMSIGAGDWGILQTGFSLGTLDIVTGQNGQGQTIFAEQYNLSGGATRTYNLTDGSLKFANVPQIFTKLKFALLQVQSPDGVKKVDAGPLGNPNALDIGCGGVGASSFSEIYDWELIVNQKWGGYGTGAGIGFNAGLGNVFSVFNPTGGAVAYNVLFIGR